MKAMIVSDFAVLRSALLQLLGICAIIALFMGYVMGAVGTAAAIAAMVPFMGLFSLAAYDEQNNWERFRLTLPLTRRQVVFGRYASIALNREFEASVRSAGDVLPRRALSLSRGAVNQLYLAVRLAVCDLALPAADPAPLVLDDALADFDDGRMALALETLEEYARGRQVLLFTCHGREAAWQEGRR